MISDTKTNWNWDKSNNTLMGQYLMGKEVAFINKTLSNSDPKLMLDIGGGDGRISVRVVKGTQRQVIVFDINKTALLKVPECENMYLVEGDASRNPPFGDCTFDAILAIELIEFLPDLRSFLCECARVLRPGGRIIFSFSNHNSVFGLLYPYIFKDRVFYRYNQKIIRRILEDSELNFMGSEGYRWLPFSRASNNPLLPLFAKLEQFLKPITSNPAISPWVLVLVEK